MQDKYQVAVLVRGTRNDGKWKSLNKNGELVSTPWLKFHELTGVPVSGSGGWNCEFEKEEAELKTSDISGTAIVIPVVY